MILQTRDKRQVEIEDIDCTGEVEDCYITSAYYLDYQQFDMSVEDATVSEDVLSELNEDYRAEIEDAWFQYKIGQAE